METTMELIFIYAALFASVCAFVAKDKGRDPAAWAIIGAIGGIFALVAVGMAKPVATDGK